MSRELRQQVIDTAIGSVTPSGMSMSTLAFTVWATRAGKLNPCRSRSAGSSQSMV